MIHFPYLISTTWRLRLSSRICFFVDNKHYYVNKIMEQKVPGGRKISLAEEEFVYDSEPEDGLPYERACGNDRPAGQQPSSNWCKGSTAVFGRQTLYCHKSNIAPLNLLYQSYTMDEKKKSRRLILRSFGYLVNKIIKQVSATTTKIVRRQSGGSDRDEDRAITGSNHLPDLGLHLERMMPSGHLTPGSSRTTESR